MVGSSWFYRELLTPSGWPAVRLKLLESKAEVFEKEKMARIEIEMINNFVFETELEVRMAQINVANHVGHDAFVSLMNEARVRFLDHLGFQTITKDGKGLIIADLAVSYKAQAFYKDRLKFEIGTGDFNKYGCDIFYRITKVGTGEAVVHAKTGVVFFDYLKNKIAQMPEIFVSKLGYMI